MKRSILLINLFLFYNLSYSQGINNNWLLGYNNNAGLPWGRINIDFFTGAPIISYIPNAEMGFGTTHANISDLNGNILFYTNGYYIANSLGDTMQNGSGLNPSQYTSQWSDGLHLAQSNLIIPKPSTNAIYYLFHTTIDDPPNNSIARYLYYSIIDLSLNNGLGAVVQKNIPIITDSLNAGKIAACKHANGRDWWIIVHKVNSNLYYKLLVTPNGILPPYTQNIGSIRQKDAGHAKFSPDGTKFAYFYNGLDIYDFDRCNGNFSNSLIDNSIPFMNENIGIEFSSNSKYLYVSNVTKIYQYNLSDTNPIITKQIVAEWDTFYSPNPPFGTYLCYPQLAPDGKIYVTTGNGTFHMHRINYPDSLGLACDVDQHSVQLPAYYFNTVPNHPNYFLDADSGSVCDTIVTTVDVFEPPEIKIKTFPNPNNGIFTLGFLAQKEQGVLEIYDVLGNLILKEPVAQWSQYKRVDIENASTGIYLCKFTWGDKSANVKVMKE